MKSYYEGDIAHFNHPVNLTLFSNVQSEETQANKPRLFVEVNHTPRLHPGYTPVTPRLHPGYTPVTPRLHPGYTPVTPRSHPGYTPVTPRLHPGYTPVTPR